MLSTHRKKSRGRITGFEVPGSFSELEQKPRFCFTQAEARATVLVKEGADSG